MSKSYHKIMENIEVTQEMRNRILDNIYKQASENNTPAVHCIIKWKKIASVAACIAILFLGAAVIPKVVNMDTPENEVANHAPEMIECKSADELSEKAGFTVQEIADIPFLVTEKSYTWCWDELAQIVYSGNDNTLVYRKAKGLEDISGDYSNYEKIIHKKINGVTITIKGNGDSCNLAIWQLKGYSFSIQVNSGIPYEAMFQIVEAIE